MKRFSTVFLSIVIASTLIGACKPETVVNPTAQALAERFSLTLTAQSDDAGAPSGEIDAAVFKATTTAQALYAARTATSSGRSAAVQATRTAENPVVAELPLYDVDPAHGHTAWIHPPVVVEANGYHSVDFKNDFAAITARDFVIAADVTWDTTFGASGCGFALRVSGSSENPSANLVAASRGRTGFIYFMAEIEGQPVNFASIYAYSKDPKFNWQKGSTNRLAVVERGRILYIYSNYTLIGAIDTTAVPVKPALPDLPQPPARPQLSPGDLGYTDAMQRFDEAQAQYEEAMQDYRQTVESIDNAFKGVVESYSPDAVVDEGFMALMAYAESGTSTCKFDNAWLWIIDP